MKDIEIFDSTLRDGLHASKQICSEQIIAQYCQMVDGAGESCVIVGHGNGLGASSIQMDRCSMEEMDMLKCARQHLRNTRLGTFVTIGFGTINEQIKPAIQIGVDDFCIAAHCTEADTMRKHIEFLTQEKKRVFGVLMNIQLATGEELIRQAKLIESYGADGLILMDSAGSSTMEDVSCIISELRQNVNFLIGFHAHNNLGLAVANAYTAVCSGADIIDGTVGGFGAGAGNCQLEAVISLLKKGGYCEDIEQYTLMDAYNKVIKRAYAYEKGIDDICIVSGCAGVVSTFKNRVMEIAQMLQVDPREIFVELGKKRVVSGQDDMILEIAKKLAKEKSHENENC